MAGKEPPERPLATFTGVCHDPTHYSCCQSFTGVLTDADIDLWPASLRNLSCKIFFRERIGSMWSVIAVSPFDCDFPLGSKCQSISLVVSLEEIIVVGHPLDQMVPVLWRQRWHPESFTGSVEAVPSRWVDGVTIGLLQIHDPRLVVQNGTCGSLVIAVHVVDAVARIQAVVGRHRWTDVGYVGRPASIHFIVEHFVLVKMRVAEKLARNRRLVPATNKFQWNNLLFFYYSIIF